MTSLFLTDHMKPLGKAISALGLAGGLVVAACAPNKPDPNEPKATPVERVSSLPEHAGKQPDDPTKVVEVNICVNKTASKAAEVLRAWQSGCYKGSFVQTKSGGKLDCYKCNRAAE